MPDELPKGWVKTTLGEVCAMNPRTPFDDLPPEDTEVSFVPMAAVEEESGRLDADEIRPLGAVRKGYTPFKENDVIFAKITPCMENGKIALATGLKNGLAYGSTEFVVFRPYQGVLPRFVLHFLMQSSFRNEAQSKMSGAVGQKRVPTRYLFIHNFPLPPTSEQERILMKLDALLSRVEAGEAAAGRAKERLKRYRAAVLHAAVTGELTRAWRKAHKPIETGHQLLKDLLQKRRILWEEGEFQRLCKAGKAPKDDQWKARYIQPATPKTNGLPILPREWAWTNLSQLKAYSIYGPRFGSSDYAKKGIAVLRTTDIDDRGRVSLKSCPKLPLTKDEYEKYKVEIGDLLVTRTGSIGTLAIFNDTVKAIPGAYLLHYRLVDPAVVGNVYTFLRSPKGQKQLWEESAGSGRQNLSAPGLENIAIPLPPIEEQEEIDRQIQRRQNAADRLLTALNRQLARAQATRQSLLSEAFLGHLVSQSSDDEPASALLDRIRAARGAEAQKPKTKRLGTKTMRKLKPVQSLEQLVELLNSLGGSALPERLLLASGLGDDVETFFDLLRAGRNEGCLFIPTGKGSVIRRKSNAN